MTRTELPGTMRAALCLALLLIGASCQRQLSGTAQPNLADEAREREDLVRATLEHPSLQPGSNQAGAPVQVDPYPHSAGMAHHPTNVSHDDHSTNGSEKR